MFHFYYIKYLDKTKCPNDTAIANEALLIKIEHAIKLTMSERFPIKIFFHLHCAPIHGPNNYVNI